MAADTVKNPPGVLVKGKSWFHQGWIEGTLHVPERVFDDVDNPVLDTDIDAYKDGYAMAVKTRFEVTRVCGQMQLLGQLVVEQKRR